MYYLSTIQVDTRYNYQNYTIFLEFHEDTNNSSFVSILSTKEFKELNCLDLLTDSMKNIEVTGTIYDELIIKDKVLQSDISDDRKIFNIKLDETVKINEENGKYEISFKHLNVNFNNMELLNLSEEQVKDLENIKEIKIKVPRINIVKLEILLL